MRSSRPYEPSFDPSKAGGSEDFEDLYQNAPCGYLSMDPAGHILRVNTTLTAWIGRSADALISTRFRDLLTIGTLIHYETNVTPALTLQGFVEEVSLDLRTASGGTVAVIAGAKVVTDMDGQPVQTRMALLTSSDRRKYERQLVEARDESRSALATERETSELREQFIAVLGHDLRNPLASIAAGGRLLQKEQPAEKRKLLFETIQASAVRMSGLIDNVLDFARGRLGSGIPLSLRPDVDLPPLIEQVVAELRIGVPDRQIETVFLLPAPIRCDPSRIGQLVSNLVGNALTHGSAAVPVRLSAASDGTALTISVANSGAPISPAAMDRLFQPFFRGEVRSSQQGLGLGLHIASEIAKAHGGTLHAVSTAAETRFTFSMPIDG